MELGESVYQHVRELPPEERFGLAAQIRRAAISVPSNIAEGHAFRSRPRAYCRHIRIALGSFAELDTQIEMAARLNMLNASSVEELRGKLGESANSCTAYCGHCERSRRTRTNAR